MAIITAPAGAPQPSTAISLRDLAALAAPDAEVYLGVGYSTLAKWRGDGRGPK